MRSRPNHNQSPGFFGIFIVVAAFLQPTLQNENCHSIRGLVIREIVNDLHVNYHIETCRPCRRLLQSRHSLPSCRMDNVLERIRFIKDYIDNSSTTFENSFRGNKRRCEPEIYQSSSVDRTDRRTALLNSYKDITSVALDLYIIQNQALTYLTDHTYSEVSENIETLLCELRKMLYGIPMDQSVSTASVALERIPTSTNIVFFTCNRLRKASRIYQNILSSLERATMHEVNLWL